MSADLDLGVRVGDVVHFHAYAPPGVAVTIPPFAAIVTRIAAASERHAVDLVIFDDNGGMRFASNVEFATQPYHLGCWGFRPAAKETAR